MIENNSLVGKTLKERYRIEELLGNGGFGITYRAIDKDLSSERPCVVKHLKPQDSDPKVLEIAKKLFDREAKSLQNLGKQHDQIPELFAYFEENGEFYLVQEFIEGHDLTEELIPGKQMDEQAVVELLKNILEVLAFVHDNNIIHRDIKPQNLMRRKQDGKIVVIDFGAVKQISILTSDAKGQPSVSAVVGTPDYMPIEQIMGQANYCSDIYAVGMIGIQALTGRDIINIPIDSTTGELIWRKNINISKSLTKININEGLTKINITESLTDINIGEGLTDINVSDELAYIIDKMVYHDFRKRYHSIDKVLKAFKSPRLNPHLLDEKYTVLLACLKVKDWKGADRETVNLMLEQAGRVKQGYLDIESLKNFPCEILLTIDDLWVKYSNGRFGFSIQNRIWKEIVGGNPNPNWEMYEQFAERVGWHKKYEIIWYGKNLIFDIDQAPRGHLPVGRFGNIFLLKKIVGSFGGFGLNRIEALSLKLSQCESE
ncbi:MAG: GUN4 domain-containing protein [Cyanomargarita calcarea GSE-NOS-MK-12-04C]|jgi:serine/threonine protein kinase|uniref:non-specific serine/threonine protein kinase n=1 Tax=Cyanomargarita calcarea GSE-NOS-MK-12-04C TaxID=2839659 RepID=A0A951QQW9_9CYAN|nr:GUN4 domain-containing protein [Cyanomargarita calcarea GSE-NOS-MK-12-04C]